MAGETLIDKDKANYLRRWRRRKIIERCDETHPLVAVEDERIENAVNKSIKHAQEDPHLKGKLYIQDILVTLFGSKNNKDLRNPRTRLSVKRRIYVVMDKFDYPVILRTQNTVIWDVRR
jgi:hypothetical protein